MDRQRIDKWLWHARLVRTRSAAAALVAAGHVRIDGRRVTTPAYTVKSGAVLTLALNAAVKVLKVESFCDRRGGAPQARALYRDLGAENIGQVAR
ncbi:MAG TPA: S4 domain-containing protein [Pseudolabrys sp.]|nr:S4 domain-containing protein [Pseudolabrys sp.]